MSTTSTIPAEQANRFGHGMCVAMIERNGYNDSEFTGVFAVPAYDGNGYTFVRETTGSTAYGGGFVSVEDATDDVMAAYRVHRDAAFARMAADRAEDAKRKVEVGKSVTVVEAITRGVNKTPVGATGTVARRVVNQYDSRWAIANDRRSYRVQVAMHDGRTIWMDENRVRVTGFEDADRWCDMSMVYGIVAGQWPDR